MDYLKRPLAGCRWLLAGRVQGVGFRPFVYRLAQTLELAGWVQNCNGLVEVWAWGTATALETFAQRLLTQAPPLARPTLHRTEWLTPPAVVAAQKILQEMGFEISAFTIRPSALQGEARIHVPPDYYACPDCVRELFDPADRRYRYPFINCTQCGPRYTLIERLPYDRPNTTLANFPLCPTCQQQYHNPADRRFHAQPLACPTCGPQLTYHQLGQPPLRDSSLALAACVTGLRQGQVIAVKGVGGYHLMCDANDSSAIARLRARKPRPHKPLAVMVPETGSDGLAWVRRLARLRPEEENQLRDPMRPICLLTRHPDAPLDPAIAPELTEVGLMLPYSPLHHLLLEELDRPLVATSANLSGEPVLTEGEEVEERLGQVADAFLHHNRPICRPADDSIWRYNGGTLRPLRLGRGAAPLELTVPLSFKEPLLAVGGQLKTTIALAWENRLVLSPHVGDLGTVRSQLVFERLVTDLPALYGVTPKRVICDAHPDYRNSRWAQQSSLPVTTVYHHFAHASGLVGEALLAGVVTDLEEPWLVFTWDGTGLGQDGTLWGGEALWGWPGHWQRVASFRPFRLPGGERAGREPWRSAAALLWETGETQVAPGTELARHAWERGLNCPSSTAVGRLFDGLAALMGLVKEATFEGQGPLYLEALAGNQPTAANRIRLPLAQDANGLWRSDWQPLLTLARDTHHTLPQRAVDIHAALANVLVDQTLAVDFAVKRVGLCGGVFQNHRLTTLAQQQLQAAGFQVFLPERLPVNDGGISFGQIIEARPNLY